MINLWLTTDKGQSLLNVEHLVSMNYWESTGQFYITMLGEGQDRSYNLKQGTPAHEVWNRVTQALRPFYDPRSMHVHAIQSNLDIADLQDKEVPF